MNSIYTPKQLELLRLWQADKLKRINLLSGSVRSGKTWISLVLWAFWVGTMPKDKNYLMTAKSLTTLKRNALDLLVELVGEQNFTYSLAQKEAYLFGRKVYLEGANDARAESKIRGMTLQGAYCDELTLFGEDFFTMLLSRLSESDAKLIATTNPDIPTHWLRKNYIERRSEIDMLLMEFLIEDNIFLDSKSVKQLKKEYVGVFYDRFISGKWVAAEGVIYGLFANDKNRYTIGNVYTYLEETNQSIRLVSFGVDFGGNRSATSFTATLITNTGTVIIADEAYIKKELNPDTLNTEYAAFIERNTKLYGAGVTRADSAESVLIRGLDLTAKKQGLRTKVKLALKRPINDRIKITLLLMAQDRLKICKNCIHTIDAFASAVYDDKKLEDTRLDDGNMNIDSLDSFEYSVEPYIEQIERSCLKRRD